MVEIVLTKNETVRSIFQSCAIGECIISHTGALLMKYDKNWWIDLKTGLSYHEQFFIDSELISVRKVKKLRIEVILD